MRYFFTLIVLAYSITAIAQKTTELESDSSVLPKPDKDLRVNLNHNGSHYIKATFTAQIWMRYNESNPGTTVNGYDKPQTYDIGLRRVRSQIYGKITDKVFFYTQVGINNFGYNSAPKPGIFFHDVVAEYYVTPRALQVGAGLTAWTGLLRYSSPSVASILSYDAPLYQQSTNDINDQFLRKLGIYAKGKLGNLDYRLIVSNPMLINASTTTVKPINTNSDFSYKPPQLQSSGYLMYQFWDEESNLTPYMTGTYLGKKNVFNIGAGFQYQPNAMWHYGSAITKDTIMQNMIHYGVDVFLDHPVGTEGAAVTAYAAASYSDYGKNYVRNNGAMNPAPGAGTSFNGGGSAFPMIGTGTTIFGQVGYLLPRAVLGSTNGQLQPYVDMTVSQFDRLNDNVLMWDAGMNWLMEGHRSKLSLNYQNRPVFSNTELKETTRKGMVVLQFQIAI